MEENFVDIKQELIKKIEDKEIQLQKAERESDVWNNKSKLKNSSNAKMSKIYVESLIKEIRKLREQLDTM
jgi:hypothetical protein